MQELFVENTVDFVHLVCIVYVYLKATEYDQELLRSHTDDHLKVPGGREHQQTHVIKKTTKKQAINSLIYSENYRHRSTMAHSEKVLDIIALGKYEVPYAKKSI